MATKKVRILVDHPVDGKKYRANDVVEFDAEAAASLIKAGLADDNKAAVAYALEQNGGVVVKHEKPAEPEQPPAGDGEQTEQNGGVADKHENPVDVTDESQG